ncbi:MAG: hypothetical protein AAGM38_00435 [Pseudomonadota bacterium]
MRASRLASSPRTFRATSERHGRIAITKVWFCAPLVIVAPSDASKAAPAPAPKPSASSDAAPYTIAMLTGSAIAGTVGDDLSEAAPEMT